MQSNLVVLIDAFHVASLWMCATGISDLNLARRCNTMIRQKKSTDPALELEFAKSLTNVLFLDRVLQSVEFDNFIFLLSKTFLLILICTRFTQHS